MTTPADSLVGINTVYGIDPYADTPGGHPGPQGYPIINGTMPDMATNVLNGKAPAGIRSTPPAAPATTARRGTRPVPTPSRWKRLSLHGEGFLSVVTYLGAYTIAAIGGSQAAHEIFGWPFAVAIPGWLFLEVLSVLFSVHADLRRQKGEAAIMPRVMSWTFALGIAGANWFGHYQASPLTAGLFAGSSLAAFIAYLFQAGARRRDTLRAAGMLPPTPPSYGPIQWLSHPVITYKAKQQALKHPHLGRQGSLDAVATAAIEAAEDRALEAYFRGRLAQDNTPAEVEALLLLYPPRTMAPLLRARMDSAKLADLIAGEVGARAILGGAPRPPAQPIRAPRVSAAVEGNTGTVRATTTGTRGAVKVQPAMEKPPRRSASQLLHEYAAALAAHPGATTEHIARQVLGLADSTSIRQAKRKEPGLWAQLEASLGPRPAADA